jgi:hypothetical protein
VIRDGAQIARTHVALNQPVQLIVNAELIAGDGTRIGVQSD